MERLDVRGKVCPMPLFYTKRKIESLEPGEELEVITNDPTACDTIPRWSTMHHHEILASEREEDYYRIVIRKGKEGTGLK